MFAAILGVVGLGMMLLGARAGARLAELTHDADTCPYYDPAHRFYQYAGFNEDLETVVDHNPIYQKV